jgi:hypothetical protein
MPPSQPCRSLTRGTGQAWNSGPFAAWFAPGLVRTDKAAAIFGVDGYGPPTRSDNDPAVSSSTPVLRLLALGSMALTWANAELTVGTPVTAKVERSVPIER